MKCNLICGLDIILILTVCCTVEPAYKTVSWDVGIIFLSHKYYFLIETFLDKVLHSTYHLCL